MGHRIRYFIHKHIHGASRMELYIACVLGDDVLYIPKGASPRRAYIRVAPRAQRAQELFERSAHEAPWIWIVFLAGASGLNGPASAKSAR